jgi:mannosyltransferase
MSNGKVPWTGGAHRQHTGAFVLVGVVMALALILRLFHIERESLWIDEAYSIWFARQPYGDLVGDIAKTEFNPPLYYLMLHAWVDLLGESVLSIRLLSSLINVATIPLVYLAARWSVPERDARVTGLLAATLFALCFAQIQYAHDARAYALLVLGFSVVVAASVRIIRDLAAMTGMPGDRPAQWPWLMLGFGAALTLWSHYSSLLLLVVAGLAHVAIWIGPGRERVAILGLYLRSVLIFLLLAAPVLWLFVAYAMPGSGDFWIKPPSLPDMLDATSTIFGAAFSLPSWRSDLLLRLAIFAPWPVLGLAYGLFRGDKHVRTSAALLFALSLGAFALYLVVTYVGRPVFLQRVVLPTQLGWIVLCAMAPLVFPAGRLRHAASALLVVFFSAGAIAYHEARPEITRKEPWGKTAALVAQHSPEGATVFTSGSGEVIIGYYLDQLGRSDIELVPVSGSLSIPEVRQPFEAGAGYYSPPLTAEGAARMKARMSADDGIYWLVLRNPDGRALEPYKAVFDEFGSPGPVCDHFMPGPVGVYRVPQRRYEPCGPSPTGERP